MLVEAPRINEWSNRWKSRIVDGFGVINTIFSNNDEDRFGNDQFWIGGGYKKTCDIRKDGIV